MIKLPKYIDCELQFAKLMYLMEETGIYLDVDKCQRYLMEIRQQIALIDNDLLPAMPSKSIELTTLNNIYKKDGELNCHADRHINSGQPYEIIGTQMKRWQIDPPNPNSADQLREFLLSLGWKPSDRLDAWNYKKLKNEYGKMIVQKDSKGKWLRTTPKLPKEEWELEILAKKSPLFRLVAKRLVLQHRLSSIEGYLKHRRAEDGRIPMCINSCGTNTMRVIHSVTCNVPKVEKFMGKELRSVFAAPPGRVLVGCDMSGQEACILAHLLGDKDFIKSIQENNYKYHNYFYNICKEFVSSPGQQKGVNFAFIYGAQDRKLGTLCDLIKDPNKEKVGARLRKLLEENVPNLKEATEKLRRQFKRYGAIQGLDGRWIKCRKESALLNTYCQSGGAICSKIWTCKYRAEIDKYNLDSKHIIFYHDENAEETVESCANQVGFIMKDSINWTSEYLKMKIPLTGTYKIGTSWADIH